MNATKIELIEKGWQSIGFEGALEYFAKADEHGSILYIATHEDKTVGNIRSLSLQEIKLLSSFIN